MSEDKPKNSPQKSSSQEKFMPFMVILIAVLSFAVGILWQKVTDLEKNGVGGNNNVAQAPSQPTGPTTGKLTEDQASNLPKVDNTDRIKGSLNAEVFLIEYSDYECPFCSRFHPTAQQAFDEYAGKVALVYRHFPLDMIHPKARPAAVASECVFTAGGNDAFWKFTDYVFANQTTALADLNATSVTSTGINITNCLAKNDDSVVEAQYQGGVNAGVTGTPGNFIVNKKGEVWLLAGAVPYANLKSTIDEALGN